MKTVEVPTGRPIDSLVTICGSRFASEMQAPGTKHPQFSV